MQCIHRLTAQIILCLRGHLRNVETERIVLVKVEEVRVHIMGEWQAGFKNINQIYEENMHNAWACGSYIPATRFCRMVESVDLGKA